MNLVKREEYAKYEGAAQDQEGHDDPLAEHLLDAHQLNRYREESIQQPNWRIDAGIDEDYYDSNQYDAQTLADMESKGIPPIVVNMIGPTIDLVLGMEAKTRTDWVCRPDTDDAEDVALAMTVKLKEAERLSMADEACAMAYADQLQAGVGWVEAAREINPFRYPYRVRRTDWREMWWDMYSEEKDLDDARWLMRRKFFDISYLCKLFPKHADNIRGVGKLMGWVGQGIDPRAYTEPAAFYKDGYTERDYTTIEMEWIDTYRGRMCLDEVWYRTYVSGEVLMLQDGRVLEFDERNPMHIQAERLGMARLERRVYPKMRLSFWLGALKLMDIPTPYEHHDFPYVPFWGYREKRTRVPYGMIRRMRPLQDEVNARRAKMMWGLNARRVIVDADAVKDHNITREEVSRMDSYIILESDRRPNSKLVVEESLALNDQQFKAYLDSKQTLQDAGGIYHEQIYKNKTADSGVAIAQLIEQSSTTLANINSNYKTGRTGVGERICSMIRQDIGGRETPVKVKKGQRSVEVVLNHKVTGPNELVTINNSTTRAQMKVVLDDLPTSQTFRQQQFKEITQMVAALPPNIQAMVIDMVVEASDMPNKTEFAERIRMALGIGKDPADMTPEEKDAAMKAMKMQEKLQEGQLRELFGKVAKIEAEGALTRAKTVKEHAATQQIVQDIVFQDKIEPPAGPVEGDVRVHT